MNTALIIAIALYLLAAAGLLVVAFILFRRGWFMAWLKGSFGFSLLAIVGGVLLLGTELVSFQSLPQQGTVATLVFTEQEDRQFKLELTQSNGQRHQLVLSGEQWQLDVSLLEGLLDPAYQLHAISGRFLTLEDENNRLDESEYRFKGDGLLSNTGVQAGLAAVGWETQTLSADFMPMTNGAIYQVFLEKGTLQAKAVNDQARLAIDNAW